MSNLARKTIDGATLNVSSILFKTLLQFIVVLPILARIIPPEEFGYVAMAMAFVGLFTMFNDLGISAALVRADEPSPAFWSTAFWTNIGLGASMTLLALLVAPAIADFYREPVVEPLVQALSAMVMMHCVFLVPMAWMQRNFRFGTIAAIDLVSNLVSAVVAIVAAFQGLGMWALVLQQISLYLVKMIGGLALQHAPVRLVYDFSEIKAVLPFSLRLTGESFVSFINRNADNILIGRVLGAEQLGFYGRAYQIMLVPVSMLSWGAGYALYPAMASIKHETERLRTVYLKSLSVITGIALPMMTGLAMVSDPFVALVFGPNWEPVVPVLSILAFVGVIQTIGGPTHVLWKALGNSKILLQWALIRMVGFVMAFAVGVYVGSLVSLAMAYLFANFILFVPLQLITLRHMQIRVGEFMDALLPTIVSSCLMAMAIFGLQQAWPNLETLSSIVQLSVLVPFGMMVFGVSMFVLFNGFVRGLIGEAYDMFQARSQGASTP